MTLPATEQAALTALPSHSLRTAYYASDTTLLSVGTDPLGVPGPVVTVPGTASVRSIHPD